MDNADQPYITTGIGITGQQWRQTMDNKTDLLNLTGLWAHAERPEVYSAKMQMGTVWLRRNADKQDEKDADWLLSFSNADKTLVNLAGLYFNQSKSGKEYLAGNFGGLRIMCFFLDKKTDKSPDISVCVAPKQSRPDN